MRTDVGSELYSLDLITNRDDICTTLPLERGPEGHGFPRMKGGKTWEGGGTQKEDHPCP